MGYMGKWLHRCNKLNKLNMQNSYAWLALLLASLCATCLMGCATSSSSSKAAVVRQPFGKTQDGTPADLFTLRNSRGAEVRISNYGGIVVSLTVPDRYGKMVSVVLGYDNLVGYLKQTPYFGALVGRYGNRIAKGKFTLNGKEYTLAINNGPNSLHGGLKGFDKVVWEPKVLATSGGTSLELHYVSK